MTYCKLQPSPQTHPPLATPSCLHGTSLSPWYRNKHGVTQHGQLPTTDVCVQPQCNPYGICGVPQINTPPHHCHLTGAMHPPKHEHLTTDSAEQSVTLCLGTNQQKRILGSEGSKGPCILTCYTTFINNLPSDEPTRLVEKNAE